MEVNHAAIIQMELKYCERCGGLFLRRVGINEVFCAGCTEQMVGWGMVRKRSRPKLPVNREGAVVFELARRAEGGNA